MQTLDNLLFDLDNLGTPTIQMEFPLYGNYKYSSRNQINPNPEYSRLVSTTQYKWIQPMQDFAPYKNPWVISWTVPGSEFSHKNPDFYHKANQHEAIHHLEWILSLDNHGLEEHTTRQTDWHWEQMGYDVQSVPYTQVKTVEFNSNYG